ncbi:MAG: exodeoxyribonuclease VII small subunit [Lachnospiraceae bacterium]|nr:exodeoxyribonuclease VII small subunit [Lachnospiraceae bacterium]
MSAENAQVTEGGFEEQYEMLEQIVAGMQDPEASLQESFENYKKGMKLVKSLTGMIDQIEKEVIVLSEQEDM